MSNATTIRQLESELAAAREEIDRLVTGLRAAALLRDECGRLEKERDATVAASAAMRAIIIEYEELIETSSRWLNDSTLWDGDEYLGPKWQSLRNKALATPIGARLAERMRLFEVMVGAYDAGDLRALEKAREALRKHDEEAKR